MTVSGSKRVGCSFTSGCSRRTGSVETGIGGVAFLGGVVLRVGAGRIFCGVEDVGWLPLAATLGGVFLQTVVGLAAFFETLGGVVLCLELEGVVL